MHGEEEMLYTVDFGSDCSLVRESIVRRLKLVFKRADTTIFRFNHSLVAPLARSKINIKIDNITSVNRSRWTIVERSHHWYFDESGVQAISDATGVTFTFNRLDKRNNRLEVNVNVDERKTIEINDIYCGELDGKDRVRPVKLLNDYRDCISLDFRESRKTSATEINIKLKDDEPICRLSKGNREVSELVAIWRTTASFGKALRHIVPL